MGIHASSAKLLYAMLDKHRVRGSCLTIGRQNISFSALEMIIIRQQVDASIDCSVDRTQGAYHRSQEFVHATGQVLVDTEFFMSLGIAEVRSVDVSAFEGSDYVFDMNNAGLRQTLGRTFDLIFEAGTAEHVFHIPNYFANLADSLAIGGCIIQGLPVNNFVDHGFYQFSPTMLHSFYSANNFELLDILMMFSDDDLGNDVSWRRYCPGEFDTVDLNKFHDKYVSVMVVARKHANSTSNIIPQQRIYSSDLNWSLGLSSTHLDSEPEVEVLQGPFKPGSGYCWMIALRNVPELGDGPDAPKNSHLVLLEDGRVIGKAHSLHDDIRKRGGGLYSHWEGVLFFSSSDNSDPNTNGRRYTLKKLHRDNRT